MADPAPTPKKDLKTDQFLSASGSDPEMLGGFELLRPSWEAIKLNLITLIEFVIIPIILSILSAFLFRRHGAVSSTLRTGLSYSYSTTKQTSYSGAWLGANILSIIVSMIFAPGLIYTLLEGAKGVSVDFTVAFKTGLKFFWRYVGVAICTGFLVGIGLILLIVPGIFMLRRYYLAPYFLIDQNLGVFEALRTSAEESKRFSGPVFRTLGVQVLFAFMFIIPILGWIAGFILSIMYYNAPAIRYLEITKAGGKTSSKPATAPVA